MPDYCLPPVSWCWHGWLLDRISYLHGGSLRLLLRSAVSLFGIRDFFALGISHSAPFHSMNAGWRVFVIAGLAPEKPANGLPQNTEG